MRTILKAVSEFSVVLLLAVSAHAAPITYEMTFIPTLGPAGVGAFDFDATTGTMTNFHWDFGGVIGGMVYSGDVFGDTVGRFIFEILSQTEVFSGGDCIFASGGSCSATGLIASGSGPGGVNVFQLATSDTLVPKNIPAYSFFIGGTTTEVAHGRVVLGPVVVPEPGTLALLGLGLAGLGFARRKR